MSAPSRSLPLSVPVTADTLVHIGSSSKTMAAATVMQLVEQGRVDLDAPLSRYVPEFSLLPRFPGVGDHGAQRVGPAFRDPGRHQQWPDQRGWAGSRLARLGVLVASADAQFVAEILTAAAHGP